MATHGDHPQPKTGADSDTPDPLIAFVPRLAVELGRGPVPSWTSVEGSMLSADISGFTALSERLAGKGKAGAEEITSLINTCFTALIDSAYRYGGEVIKFGGDALLILFRGEQHERRAADAGLLMQRALHSTPVAKRAHLTMTVGIAAGPFDVFLVGTGYRELLITGPRATEVIRFEGEAAKGDTLVDPLIAERLPDEMRLREEHGGWVITGSTGDAPSGPSDRYVGHDDLSPYVPAAVVEQLSAFSDLGGEHRLVTVGFVMVVGLAEQLDRLGPSGVASALGSIVDDVVAACDAYGVTVLHTDIAPDGLKFVLCAGAPVSPGDTTDALLHAALAITESASPFVIRQGVQAGRVFAGFLGSPHRRTYTLMGDPVNTAARMLGKAADREIVAVESAVEHTRTLFVTDELEPFLVKGKSEPITAHVVRSSSDEARRDIAATRLFGRRDELGILGQGINELGEVIVLSGAAGVGKSRLLEAAWHMAEGLHIFQAACTPYGMTSPYSVFRPLLRAGSGIDLHADPATTGELLDKIVRQAAPSMLPWLPLLAVPFGAEVPPTAESDAVDPKFRRARIHDAVLEFLDSTLEGPVFLVVEDLHWIDEASGELLNRLIRAAGSRPWTSVLTRRPTGAWMPPDDVEHLRFLSLDPLPDDDVRSLATEISERPLSDTDLDTIVARSGGNPLFSVELTRALTRGTSAQLPDSIEELIATRIDELPPEQRRLMRVAAVFGREFDLDDVTAIASDAVAVGPQLDEMIEREHSTAYRFRHAMYRDVAYEGLPYGQRERLHDDVGRHLEAKAADPEAIAGLLSLHFAAARAHAAAFRYASIAAAHAAAAYAHQDAVEFYTRALKAGRHVRDVEPRERAALMEQLGRSYEFSGQLSEADRVYTKLLRLTDDVGVKVDCLRRRARVRQKQNRLTAAVRLLSSAQQQLRRLDPEQSVDRRLAEIHLNLAGVRMDQGQLAQARAEAEAAERHALRAGERGLEVQAYGAIVGAMTEWEEAAPYADKGFDGVAPSDAWEARSILGTNLGMVAYFAGRWEDAVDFYDRGRAAAETIGNVTSAALASMNAAEILVDQGRLEPAVDALHQVRRVLGAAGYEAALLYAELLHATALSRLGETGQAIAMLERCESEFRSGSMQLYALESLLRLAEATFVDGSPERAERLARQALDESSTVARSAVIEARAERLLGLVDAARGDLDSARAHLDSAIRACQEGDLRFELALALAARVGVTGDNDDDALGAAGLFDDLSVVEAGRPNPHRYWLPGISPAR